MIKTTYKIGNICIKPGVTKYNRDSIINGLSLDLDREYTPYQLDRLDFDNRYPFNTVQCFTDSNIMYVLKPNCTMYDAIKNYLGISNNPDIDNLFNRLLDNNSHSDIFKLFVKYIDKLDNDIIASIELI